jgi:hypothetical protein
MLKGIVIELAYNGVPICAALLKLPVVGSTLAGLIKYISALEINRLAIGCPY